MFLNKYYYWYKTNEIIKVSTKVLLAYEHNNYKEKIDLISYQEGICVEIIKNKKIIYQTSGTDQGCITNNYDGFLNKYQIDFIKSGDLEKGYKLLNEKYGNDILVRAVKLDNDSYLFINTSLEPMDSTILILKNQFIYVTLIVLILSFVVSYFISKRIASPIVDINKNAKELASGNYDLEFNNEEEIHEINELFETLEHTRKELLKTEELRREFLANISHDLKTPLTMIKAYAEMIRDINYKDKEKRTSNLNVIIDEANRLNLLVNDLLELSKIQSNNMDFNYEKFDLKKLIDEIIKKYNILIEKEGFTFIIDTPNEVLVKADKKRIEQVFYNLIDNAVKYTDIDKIIKIIVTIESDKYIVKIINTGQGIRKKDIDLIWDKYSKIDKTYSRNITGSGLGLSIVKNILEKHGFKYGVKSKINKETTFYFEIPFISER